VEFDFAAEIGAEGSHATQRLTVYLPDKDRNGRKLKNQVRWVKEARALLGRIGGGATAFPPADGTWVNDTGKMIWEQTRIVFCYVYPDRLVAEFPSLREFLHRFGRETNQGEVVVEWDARFFRIRRFDPLEGD
jgi:hypothetical protein